MDIFRGYTTDEIILNEPCFVEKMGYLHPILVKDYKRFSKYVSYILFNKKHLQLDKNSSLLKGIIDFNVYAKEKSFNGDIEKTYEYVLNELCDLFSIVAKTKIGWDIEEGKFIFKDNDNTVLINEKNFPTFRLIVLKMCMMHEPKIYDNELDEKWERKALVARSKNQTDLELGEKIIVVSQDLKMSINEIKELNILQLYCYYYRAVQIYNSETTRLFKTVDTSMKIEPFIQGMVKELYKDPTADLHVKGDFMKMFEG